MVVATPSPARQVAAAQPRWTCIVIHHSGTPAGNASRFDAAHRRRGMENGLAYHFVIDNGTAYRRDGQVETGPRWTRQIAGGHCHQDSMNQHGIGICLVGDFTKRGPSDKQMAALSSLVDLLRKRYGIGVENVRGHGQWPGESSECPGKLFPWGELKKRLARGR